MRLLGRAIRAFAQDDEAATLVEYGILILIVACLAVLTVKQIGAKVSKGFESVNSQLP
jgi:Flp pilus assembly pilin Flp